MLVVEVAHARDVESRVRGEPHVRTVRGVCHADAARVADDNVFRRAPGRLDGVEEQPELVLPLLSRHEDGEPAIGDGRGLLDRLGCHRRDPDRDVIPHGLEAQREASLQLEDLARVFQWLLPHEQVDDVDVLAQARERQPEVDPVEVLDHAMTGGAEADDHASAAELGERREVLRQGGRAARVSVDDRRSELDPARFPGEDGQDRESVTPPGLGDEQRVDARVGRDLRLLDHAVDVEGTLPVDADGEAAHAVSSARARATNAQYTPGERPPFARIRRASAEPAPPRRGPRSAGSDPGTGACRIRRKARGR